MKKIILCGLLSTLLFILAGCVGNAEPNNPLNRETEKVWWQTDTAQMKDSENPWLKFIPQRKQVDTSDPWNSFEQPALFPEGWKPALVSTKNKEYLRLRRQLLILKLRRAERIRKAKEKLDKAKKRLERLGRTI